MARSSQCDLHDVPHLGGDDQDAVGVRQRAAGQAGARAAGHERHARLGAGAHHGGGDLVRRVRQRHERRITLYCASPSHSYVRSSCRSSMTCAGSSSARSQVARAGIAPSALVALVMACVRTRAG